MSSQTPLAIVSMACRLPGANNLEEFWQLIHSGGSAIGELPQDRLDQRLYFDPRRDVLGKTYTRIGGIVPLEDREFEGFALSERDLQSADRAHLELLSVATEAMRSAGWDPHNLPHRRAGVYVGHTRGTGLTGDLVYRTLISETATYLQDVPEFQQLAGEQADNIVQHVIDQTQARYPTWDPVKGPSPEAFQAGRIISKAFQLDGPYMAMNAACASSLYALSAGAMALQLGEIDMAVVGGASHCAYDSLILFSKAGSVSATGSRPFDSQADGLVTAEGFVILVLKTLDRALADGDNIEAVIRGIGFSSDGKGKSLWAPRQEGQVEALRRAYGDHLLMERLQYIEAHATSTPVGDATEIKALAAGLKGHLPSGQRIPLGSVKANIGHTLETAGLAGLVKTVLALKRQIIPTAVGVQEPTDKVNWQETPFELPAEPRPWPQQPDGSSRRAGVNAFGIGGLNAHIVLDEYLPGMDVVTSETKPPGRAAVVAPASRAENVSAIQSGDLAIIGRGAILPGANDWATFWQRALDGQSNIIPIPPNRFATESLGLDKELLRGGYLDNYEYDWRKHKVPPKQITGADPLQFMLLDAVDQALRDSGYRERNLDASRTGVIVGSVFGGEFGHQLQMGLRLHQFLDLVNDGLRGCGASEDAIAACGDAYADLLFQRMPAMLDETGSFTSSTLASRCTKTFDLMGGATAIDSGKSSGLAALHLAAMMLKTRHTNMMIVAAGQRSAGRVTFEKWKIDGHLAADDRLSPLFAPEGSVPGEGVGVIVLKRLEDAQRDGDTVHAVIRGIGHAAGSATMEVTRTACLRALYQAGLRADEVSLVEATSAGDAKRDRDKLQGLQEAFATDSEATELHIRTVEDGIGDLGGATSMAALLRAAESVRTERVAPLLHTAPNTLTFGKRPLNLSLDQQSLPLADDGLATAAVVSAGQGESLSFAAVVTSLARALSPGTSLPEAAKSAGTETASTRPTPREMAIPRSNSVATDYQIVTLGAATVSELLSSLEATGRDPAAAFQRGEQSFQASDRFRLAFVVEHATALAEKVQPAWRGLQLERNLGHLAMQGIFFGHAGDSPNRVAFTFPGQGSQYAGMLSEWIAQDPCVADTVQQLDGILADLQMPCFDQVINRDAQRLGIDVWQTQLSMLIADTLMMRHMQRWGVQADVLIGHSFGEFPALIAAGVWDFATAAQATYARCNAILSARLPVAAMVSVLAPPERLKTLLTSDPDHLWIANRNAPEQTVVGGTVAAVERLMDRLQAEKLKSKKLAVPCAFHTPLMQPAQAAFAAAIKGLPFTAARPPLISTVTGKYESDPQRLQASLVHQLVTPVPYVDVVTRAMSDGCRLFIEVGPGQVLTGLNRRIIAERDDCVVLSMDDPRRGTNRSLACVRAALAVNDRLNHPARRGSKSLSAESSPGLDRISVASIAGTNQPSIPSASLPAAPPPASALPASVSSDETATLSPPERFMPHSSATTLTGRTHAVGRHLRTIELTGTPGEMGRQYGEQERDRIIQLVSLCAGRFEGRGRGLPDLSSALQNIQHYWAAEDLEELQGIAEGSGVAVENMMALNLWLYPDIDAGCAHFIVPSTKENATWWHGANEDLPIELALPGLLPRTVSVRRPQRGLEHVLFTVAGQVGSIAGFNRAGLSISSSMLVDRPLTNANRFGLLHGLIVKRLLGEAATIEVAIDRLRTLPRRGAWGISLLESATGKRVYLEYDGQTIAVKACQSGSLLASNHTQLLPPCNQPPEHSTNRLGRLAELFPATVNRFSLQQAQRALRDQYCPQRHRETMHPTMHTLRRVDTQASILMAPAQAKAWLAVSEPSALDAKTAAETEAELSGVADRGDAGIGRYVEVDFTNYGFQPFNATSVASHDSDSIRRLPADATAAPGTRQVEAAEGTLTPQEWVRLGTSLDGQSPVDKSDRICSRFVCRMIPRPLELDDSLSSSPATGTGNSTQGGMLILGKGPLATALAEHFANQGLHTERHPCDGEPEALIAMLEQRFPAGYPQHVVVVSNADDSGIDLDNRYAVQRKTGVMGPYRVLQWWHQQITAANQVDHSSCYAAVRTSGDLGWSGSISSVADGAIIGLIKAIRLETSVPAGKGFRAGVVDLHRDLPLADAVACFSEQWQHPNREVEVGYDRARVRHILRPINQPLPPPATSRLRGLRGAWIITGGARGVTAAVAEGLGQQVQGTLHLVGSTSVPTIDPAWCELDDAGLRTLRKEVMREAIAAKQVPVERWSQIEKAIEVQRTLQRFAKLGITCRYWGCDVSDRQRVAALLAEIRQMGEPIVGVVHGAGYEKANKFASKKPELVQRTVAAKADGCAALMQATATDPLQFFVIFGSISGRFGGIGQTDYTMSNEMVAKLGAWFRNQRPETRVVTLAWHSWDEVGMAVRPETKHAKFLSHMRYMPVSEGIEHLVNELNSDSREADVTITDWRHYKLFYPDPVWKGECPQTTTTNSAPADFSAAAKLPARSAQSELRRAMRMVPASLQPREQSILRGHALIIGTNPDAISIRDGLLKMGVRAETLLATAPPLSGQADESLFANGIPEHLIIATSRDDQAWHANLSSQWQQRVEVGLLRPFAIVQAWLRAAQRQPDVRRTLSAVTCLGGDFGLERRPLGIEGAAIAALLKAVQTSHAMTAKFPLSVKLLDASPGIPTIDLAGYLLKELASGDPAVEIGFTSALRTVPQAVAEPIGQDHNRSIQTGTAWILVDDGVGTADKIAARLASQFDLRLHILRNKRDFDSRAAVATALDVVRQKHGDLHGVICCVDAGSPDRDVSHFPDVMHADLTLTKNLIDLTRQDPLQAFVALIREPSADAPQRAGFLPADGICKCLLALQHERSDLQASGLHYGQEIDPGEILFRELIQATKGGEFWFGSQPENAAASPEAKATELNRHQKSPVDSPALPDVSSSPLLDSVAAEAGNLHFTTLLDSQTDPFLFEHQFRNRPLMPLVASLEVLAEATHRQSATDEHPIVMNDILIKNGLPVESDAQETGLVIVESTAKETLASLLADLRNRAGKLVQAQRPRVTAKIPKQPKLLVATPPTDAELVYWAPAEYHENDVIYHGPPFRALTHICKTTEAVWGRMVAPDPQELLGTRRVGKAMVPMAVLDSCLFAGGIALWLFDPTVFGIPQGIENLQINRMPVKDESLIVHIRLHDRTDTNAKLDFDVWDANRTAIISVRGYGCALVRGSVS